MSKRAIKLIALQLLFVNVLCNKMFVELFFVE